MDTVTIDAGDVRLTGDLEVPHGARGVVLFAHGSGSGRHSPRNRAVARTLNDRGFATFLLDLLTEREEVEDRVTGHLRFDIPMLAERLAAATGSLMHDPRTARLPVGYFGASTGAGAALIAEPDAPGPIAAIVSRGGRPDLAGESLPRVQAPTLLIVGSLDLPVIGMNRTAMNRMRTEVQLEIVAGATHLFEEPGTLERVADLAGGWFERWMPARTADAPDRHPVTDARPETPGAGDAPWTRRGGSPPPP